MIAPSGWISVEMNSKIGRLVTRTHDVSRKRCDSRHSAWHVIAKLPPARGHSCPTSFFLSGLVFLALCARYDFVHHIVLHMFPRHLVTARVELSTLSKIYDPSSGLVFFDKVAPDHVREDDFAVAGVVPNHFSGLSWLKEEAVVNRILTLKASFRFLICLKRCGRSNVCYAGKSRTNSG